MFWRLIPPHPTPPFWNKGLFSCKRGAAFVPHCDRETGTLLRRFPGARAEQFPICCEGSWMARNVLGENMLLNEGCFFFFLLPQKDRRPVKEGERERCYWDPRNFQFSQCSHLIASLICCGNAAWLSLCSDSNNGCFSRTIPPGFWEFIFIYYWLCFWVRVSVLLLFFACACKTGCSLHTLQWDRYMVMEHASKKKLI